MENKNISLSAKIFFLDKTLLINYFFHILHSLTKRDQTKRDISRNEISYLKQQS
jgi:hypothetical protein